MDLLRDFIAHYRDSRRAGVSHRHAFWRAMPVRVHAVYSLARGGTVIYRARIGGDSAITVTRDHSLVAETHVVGMTVRLRGKR